MKNSSLLVKALAASPVFAKTSPETIEQIAASGVFEIRAFPSGAELGGKVTTGLGETIGANDNAAAGAKTRADGLPLPGLGLVLSGRFAVSRDDEEHQVTLNILRAGACFGAASMFAGGCVEPVTRITACCAARAAFISEAAFRGLLTAYPELSIGYITFLSDRIRFLNSKVRTFSGSTTAEKAANALLACADDAGLCETGSYADFARRLNIGRASLYRAMDMMEEQGLIERGGREVRVLDRDGLSRCR